MVSYYILRSDLTSYYVNDVIERLQAEPDQRGWDVGVFTPIRCDSVNWTTLKEIEATLHCLKSIQEASPVEDNADLRRLFSSEILGLFPKAGSARVRRTTVVLIGKGTFILCICDTDDNRFLCVLVHYPTAKRCK